jgi:hypothetical protein
MAEAPVSESMKSQASRTPHDSDRLLQALVSVPERTSLEIGITITAGGLLITGFIISQETYFNTLIEGIGRTKADEGMKELLQDFLAQLKNPIIESTADKSIFPRFIHLRDVKIYPSEGRGMPTLGHTIWRGDINKINGFSLGEMVPAQFDRITTGSGG